jgi:membrane protein implicated in regulation of membrane protease activity
MNHSSAKALAWAAGLLLALALVMISPSGAFVLLVLAGLCAAIPSLFAVKRTRVVSLVLLVAVLVLAARYYPGFVHEQQAYRNRVKEHPISQQVTTPSDSGVTRR